MHDTKNLYITRNWLRFWWILVALGLVLQVLWWFEVPLVTTPAADGVLLLLYILFFWIGVVAGIVYAVKIKHYTTWAPIGIILLAVLNVPTYSTESAKPFGYIYIAIALPAIAAAIALWRIRQKPHLKGKSIAIATLIMVVPAAVLSAFITNYNIATINAVPAGQPTYDDSLLDRSTVKLVETHCIEFCSSKYSKSTSYSIEYGVYPSARCLCYNQEDYEIGYDWVNIDELLDPSLTSRAPQE